LHAIPSGEVVLAKQPLNNKIGKIRKNALQEEFTANPLKVNVAFHLLKKPTVSPQWVLMPNQLLTSSR
jgi:hypothetical protein